MRYMLDTNICSYILKKRPASVKAHFNQVHPGDLAISAVVLAELYYGAARHPQGQVILHEINDFISRLSVVPWDEGAAEAYGNLRATLEKSGRPIGAMDMMIAAHAISQKATLISNNLKHFDDIPGLLTDNWVNSEKDKP